jgi:hypothetical protein
VGWADDLYYPSMSEIPLTEPLETTIEEPEGSQVELEQASSFEDFAGVAARYPESLSAWGCLGDMALEAGRPVEAYAYYRVGYHRGLDRIRRAGWRGKGQVPWSHEGNRGFLRSLSGLGKAADAIGETSEAQRCADFLKELAPQNPL